MTTKTIKNNNWSRVLAILIPYFFVVGVFQALSSFLLGLPISSVNEIEKSSWQKFIITFFTLVGTFITVFLFRKYVDKQTFLSVGLNVAKTSKWQASFGFLLGALIMFFAYLSLLFFNQITYSNITFVLIDFILSLFIYFFVSINEELFIRGYVLNNLASSMNKYVALLISAVLFGLMHLANPNINLLSFINLVLAGILIGLPYLYTKNLWFSIAFHFSWNFFQGTVFGFNVSGLNGYSLIVQSPIGNNIWNGGEFGFEGSILSLILQVFCIIILFFIFKNRATIQSSADGTNVSNLI